MPERTLVSVFDEQGQHIQALVQSMPRSFKMHVWASPLKIDEEATTTLHYMGTIQPMDFTDSIEIEQLVRELYLKKHTMVC